MKIVKRPMTIVKPTRNNNVGFNTDALKAVADDFSKINSSIESGNEVPPELTKNFVSIPLSDDPYSGIE
jgi:hypothetical protein